jgi:hypothetical protein
MITKSPAARTALIYVTAGALTMIWTAVWYVYLRNYPPESNVPYYYCAGLMASGFVLFLLGLGLGRIGRSAQSAELPPPELTAPTATVAPPQVEVKATAPAAPSPPVANVSSAPAATIAPKAPVPVERPYSPNQPPIMSA